MVHNSLAIHVVELFGGVAKFFDVHLGEGHLCPSAKVRQSLGGQVQARLREVAGIDSLVATHHKLLGPEPNTAASIQNPDVLPTREKAGINRPGETVLYIDAIVLREKPLASSKGLALTLK